ncbi:MAG: SMI1/KNR4 family protein [Peptostreptococcus sp.]|uniref:SMI1/KNR4 family protein n=1 Tax=Peptostreptococcus sp. TaxID=1262 RepID=UPI001CB0B690|nr:SMI1/KNR4 family protein [Peptostreptococcus sp.]MBF1057434.1 SMI1/KNR4 family protein [Peptostreptococcus sp.]
MQLKDKIEIIEKYICDNFEDWDLDDPIAEEYYDDYQGIAGASDEEIRAFEENFNITLPHDIKDLYSYKNGSKFFSILPSLVGQREMAFSLMSLQAIERSKEYFQNKDSLLSDFPDYYTSEDIESMKDSRIKPYLFNKSWFPFAEYCDTCYLMLDFNPGQDGKEGQIICYIHDPDEIVYVAEGITDLLDRIIDMIST